MFYTKYSPSFSIHNRVFENCSWVDLVCAMETHEHATNYTNHPVVIKNFGNCLCLTKVFMPNGVLLIRSNPNWKVRRVDLV